MSVPVPGSVVLALDGVRASPEVEAAAQGRRWRWSSSSGSIESAAAVEATGQFEEAEEDEEELELESCCMNAPGARTESKPRGRDCESCHLVAWGLAQRQAGDRDGTRGVCPLSVCARSGGVRRDVVCIFRKQWWWLVVKVT